MKKEDILKAKKIALFGWPASGKSTLSIKIANLNNIPLYSLDLIRWQNVKEENKNDAYFEREYNKIINKDKWIIDGNALSWIDSRLTHADVLIFFDSTLEKCISNYQKREEKIASHKEERINYTEEKKTSLEDTITWLKTKYEPNIIKLRKKLTKYQNKLIVINNYEELNNIIKELEL